ncbi:hypothetical protein ACN20G_01555 [Streptomyces sp. BI20]|uniref:hypothetical protein n=1 Tax=Streptomyces sp. BI20 TaxID=3403460 RepID=UPI003C726E02
MPADPPDARSPDASAAAGPGPRREVVTGVPRGARGGAGGPAPARSEISEQTALGATYVRALMRGQLRAALIALAALGLPVLALPPLFVWASGGEAWVWPVLGLAVYPLVWVIARRYVRRAERNEADFARLVAEPEGVPREP